MGVIVCRHCQARNTEGGDCVMCQRPLGDFTAAVGAAVVSATALGAPVGRLSWLTGFQLSWFAALFGGLVSGAVAHRSAGRGPIYQAVATTATVIGILAGQTLFVFLVHDATDQLLDLELVQRVVLGHEWGVVYTVFGVAGGFWLWRDGPSE